MTSVFRVLMYGSVCSDELWKTPPAVFSTFNVVLCCVGLYQCVCLCACVLIGNMLGLVMLGWIYLFSGSSRGKYRRFQGSKVDNLYFFSLGCRFDLFVMSHLYFILLHKSVPHSRGTTAG